MSDDELTTHAEWVRRGREIFESGKYAAPRGKFLGRLESWGLDVYENSPEPWKQALEAEHEGNHHAH
jgi:hypothetical protein